MRKGQIFSMDLILGFVVFLIAVGTFYYSMNYIPSQRGFEDISEKNKYVFENLMTNTNAYDEKIANPSFYISFLENFKVFEERLANFAELTNEEVTDILIGNLDTANLDIDLCIFFENKSGNIIPIQTDINKTGIGNAENEVTQSFNVTLPVSSGKYYIEWFVNGKLEAADVTRFDLTTDKPGEYKVKVYVGIIGSTQYASREWTLTVNKPL